LNQKSTTFNKNDNNNKEYKIRSTPPSIIIIIIEEYKTRSTPPSIIIVIIEEYKTRSTPPSIIIIIIKNIKQEVHHLQ